MSPMCCPSHQTPTTVVQPHVSFLLSPEHQSPVSRRGSSSSISQSRKLLTSNLHWLRIMAMFQCSTDTAKILGWGYCSLVASCGVRWHLHGFGVRGIEMSMGWVWVYAWVKIWRSLSCRKYVSYVWGASTERVNCQGRFLFWHKTGARINQSDEN